MRRQIATLLGPLAVASTIALWLVAAPLASAGDPCYHDFEMPASTTATDTEIKLLPCAFAPTVTQVATGSTVTFFNGPAFTHLITGANQAWGSRDVEVKPGTTVSYTFAKAGFYPYACVIHRGMSGVIVVGDTASTNAGTTTGSTTAGSAATPATTSGPAGSPAETVGLIAASAFAGAVAGASAIWLSLRRRRASADDQVAGIA